MATIKEQKGEKIMSQEEKQLLLKDLCGRLPYEVIVEIEDEPQTPVQFEWQHLNFIINWEWTIKPYLRPMSSMTKEEQKELEKIIDGLLGYEARYYFHSEDDYKWNTLYEAIDWLNKKMFDYRGFIPLGLALEAPNGMYNV